MEVFLSQQEKGLEGFPASPGYEHSVNLNFQDNSSYTYEPVLFDTNTEYYLITNPYSTVNDSKEQIIMGDVNETGDETGDWIESSAFINIKADFMKHMFSMNSLDGVTTRSPNLNSSCPIKQATYAGALLNLLGYDNAKFIFTQMSLYPQETMNAYSTCYKQSMPPTFGWLATPNNFEVIDTSEIEELFLGIATLMNFVHTSAMQADYVYDMLSLTFICKPSLIRKYVEEYKAFSPKIDMTVARAWYENPSNYAAPISWLTSLVAPLLMKIPHPAAKATGIGIKIVDPFLEYILPDLGKTKTKSFDDPNYNLMAISLILGRALRENNSRKAFVNEVLLTAVTDVRINTTGDIQDHPHALNSNLNYLQMCKFPPPQVGGLFTALTAAGVMYLKKKGMKGLLKAGKGIAKKLLTKVKDRVAQRVFRAPQVDQIKEDVNSLTSNDDDNDSVQNTFETNGFNRI